MLPKTHGNMKKRASVYTAGGLIFGGAFILLFSAVAILLQAAGLHAAYFFFAALPYAVYLFMLNIVPLYYASGKTDALILRGICREKREEKAMLSAMEIFGFLSEGKSFSEIGEEYYTQIPVVAEDEPIFAVVTDLKYRYYLEKGDFDRAADAINRLATLSPYLTQAQTEEVAAELCYMHLLNGDLTLAEQTREIARDYLVSGNAAAERINAAYFVATGDKEKAENVKTAAKKALERESVLGKRKAEEILLVRIP